MAARSRDDQVGAFGSECKRLPGIAQAHLEAGGLELAADPALAVGGLDRDGGNPTPPRLSPSGQLVAVRTEALLGDLAAVRIEHGGSDGPTALP
jgi:hypothetical protein